MLKTLSYNLCSLCKKMSIVKITAHNISYDYSFEYICSAVKIINVGYLAREPCQIKYACLFLDMRLDRPCCKILATFINNKIAAHTDLELSEMFDAFGQLNELKCLTERIFEWLTSCVHSDITRNEFICLDQILKKLSKFKNLISFLRQEVCGDDQDVYDTMMKYVWSKGTFTWDKLLELQPVDTNRVKTFDLQYPGLVERFMEQNACTPNANIAHYKSSPTDNHNSISLQVSPSLFKVMSLKSIHLNLNKSYSWFELLPKNNFRRYFNCHGLGFQVASIATKLDCGKKKSIGLSFPMLPVPNVLDNTVHVKDALSVYIKKLNDNHALQVFHKNLNNILTNVKFLEVQMPNCAAKCIRRGSLSDIRRRSIVQWCLKCTSNRIGYTRSDTFETYCNCGYNGTAEKSMFVNRVYRNENQELCAAIVYRVLVQNNAGLVSNLEDLRKYDIGFKSGLKSVTSICMASRRCFEHVAIDISKTAINFKSASFLSKFKCQKTHKEETCIDILLDLLGSLNAETWPVHKIEHLSLVNSIRAFKDKAKEVLCELCMGYLMCDCTLGQHNHNIILAYCRLYMFE